MLDLVLVRVKLQKCQKYQLLEITLLNIFKGTLRVLPLITWINEAKTCLSYDKFGYRVRMMFFDENEVIPFQKCPWNALCKNGILFKNTPLFKTKFKDIFSI